MKKRTVIILICAVGMLSILVGFATKYMDLTSLDRVSGAIAMDDKYNIYFSEQNGGNVVIGRMDNTGKRISASLAAPSFLKKEVKDMVYSDGKLYYAVEVRGKVDFSLKSIQIMVVENTEKAVYSPKVLYTYPSEELENQACLNAINVYDGEVYVMYTYDNDKKAAVDKLVASESGEVKYITERMGKTQLYNHLYYADLDWYDGVLYAATEEGQVYSYENWGATKVFPSYDGQGTAIFMEASKEGVFIYNGKDLAITKVGSTGESYPINNIAPGVLRGFDLAGQNFCGIYVENSVSSIYTKEIGTQHMIDKLRFSPKVMVSTVLPICLIYAMIGIILAFAVIGISKLIKRRKRILEKFMFIMIPILFFSLALGGVAQTLILKNNVTESFQITCNNVAERLLTTIKTENVSLENAELKWRDENLTQLINRTKSMNNINNLMNTSLMTYDGTTLNNLMSYQSMCYVNADILFNPDDVNVFRQVAETGEAMDYVNSETNLAGSAIPVKNDMGKVTGIINISMAEDTGYRQISDFIIYYLLLMGIIMVVVTGMLFIVSRKYQQPVTELIRSVEQVSSGNYNARFDYEGNDEFRTVSRVFSNMVRMVSDQIYQLSKINNAYSRFLPKYLYSIFEQDSVLNIHPGDIMEKNAVIAMLSVHNLDKEWKELTRENVVDIISQMTKAMNLCTQKTGGMITSNDCNVSDMRALFTESPFDAVAYGEQIQEMFHQGGLGKIIDATVIIHQADMLFGVVGDDERVTPYITGENVQALSRIIPKFEGSNARIVITEELAETMTEKYEVRFIGFIQGRETEKKIKLYEIITACGLETKIHKSKNKDLFEKGLDVFYQGDFYTARNIFSAIMKSCPEDGLAKWYLFAADRYYSNPTERISFELFGTDLIKINH